MTVDILFTTYNRYRFAQMAWASLIRNTDWDLVSSVHVYDDGSTDGTREWLEPLLHLAPVPATLVYLGARSPVAAMNHYVETGEADWFCKIDSDCCVPPGWLPALLSVLETEPNADLIGMEAGFTRAPGRDGEPWDGRYTFRPASHIGGIGLMRVRAFKGTRMHADGLYGFTEAQYRMWMVRGWIEPDLPVVLLDRLPFEPWISLSEEYIANGWQRPWPKWDPVMMAWVWEWLPTPEAIGLA